MISLSEEREGGRGVENRQMYDSVSSPYSREGIYALTTASRPDEV